MLRRRMQANLDLFAIHVVPSASFATLVGLEPARIIVAPNGSDTAHVTPGPFPSQPTIGLVSGAAPGRGIEALVDAAIELRRQVPDLQLRLWLASIDATGHAYVGAIRDKVATQGWIEVGNAPYDRLGEILATATVLVVPHPANAYMDVAVPVKLADSMAAGRPVVVTPRVETARIVRAADCGTVASGDDPDSLAAA
ncbi:MAG TPA: glycosyltransferase, partial [Candidatus Limnocylindrales bacterium]|nr:glycosyltransferase [Candidatus Limnocylindrales bacterium]